MKKLSLVFAACCFFSSASFSQNLEVYENFMFYGSALCQSGPTTVKGGFTIQTGDFPPGQNANVHVEAQVNGVIFYTLDTVVSSTSTFVSFSVNNIPAPLSGPGTHTISVSATMVINSQTYSGSDFSTITYGPALCETYGGVIYLDKNGNCQFDGGDSAMANQEVFVNGSDLLYTNSSGRYGFMYPKNFSVTLHTRKLVANPSMQKYFPVKCPADAYYSVTLNSGTSYDFAYKDSLTSSGFKGCMFFSFNFSGCELPAVYDVGSEVYTDASDYTAYLNFGDGQDTLINIKFPGNSPFIQHTYTTAGNFTPMMTLTFQDTVATFYLYNPITVYDTCGNVSGRVYMDNNLNCLYDSLIDQPVANQLIQGKVGSEVINDFTDENGKYNFEMPASAAYSIKLGNTSNNGEYLDSKGLTVCPPEYENTAPTTDNDFGLQCVPGAQDFYVWQNGWGFRPGFNGYINIAVRNRSCSAAGGTLVVQLDPKETFVSSNPVPSRQTGNTLEWDYSAIKGLNAYQVEIVVNVSSSATIGDSVCHTATATVAGDAKPEDNVNVYCNEIRGSWDPNDKTAYINGGAKPGSDMLNTDMLLYRLRFQNTGTDTAFNIFLLDTIDPNLDLSTLNVVSYSHNMKTFINKDRVARFEFNNILLPDDKANEPESHGYVYYTIRLKQGLSPGTHIRNTGYIYFDYNPAVVTNTTDNLIVVESAVEERISTGVFSCYPNPARDLLNIELGSSMGGTLRMIDVVGKTVLVKSVKNRDTLNVSGLPNGVYILEVNTSVHTRAKKIIISK